MPPVLQAEAEAAILYMLYILNSTGHYKLQLEIHASKESKRIHRNV